MRESASMHLIKFKNTKYFEKDIVLPYCQIEFCKEDQNLLFSVDKEYYRTDVQLMINY